MKIKIYLLFVFFGMIGSSRVHAQSEYAANEKQRQELMKEYGLTADQAQSIQVFSRERTDRIEALKARNLSEQRYREEREIITDEYFRPNNVRSSTPKHSRLPDPVKSPG